MTIDQLPLAPVILLALILATLFGCDKATENTAPYQSVWEERYPNASSSSVANTLQGAFHSAANATTLEEADKRWQRVLADWMPKGGEFEDAMHAYMVRWAELELERVNHLLNNDQEALQLTNAKLQALAAEIE